MKKRILLFFLFFFVLTLASCELEVPNSNDTNSLTKTTVLDVLSEYKNKKYITVYEETTVKDNSDKEVKISKTTNIDLDNSYMYSSISTGDKIYIKDKNLYLETNNQSKPLNDFNQIANTYDLIGISELFNISEFLIKDNKAVFTIASPHIKEFKNLFENINIELKSDINYNSSVIIVRLQIENDKIKELHFDLSLVYSSYYKSVNKTITFSEEEFIKQEINVSLDNSKYLVNTGQTLDTYIIEMVYQYGDSIYVKSGDFDMLIDAGQYQDGINVNNVLAEYCEDKILDVLIGTHGHADHLGGFNNGALNSIEKVSLIIDYGYKDYGSSGFNNAKNKYINLGADYYSAYDCVYQINGALKKYKFSEDLSLEILNTNQYLETNSNAPSDGNENDYSVVCKLTFKNNTYLFTGDLSGDKFTSALKKEDVKDITVYKAAHHGANTHSSNNQAFLNYINPQICVSSAAIINQDSPHDYSINGEVMYQHPRPMFVRWILNTPIISKTKAYYFNGTMGTIHIEDNGIDLPSVTGLGPTRGYNDMYGTKILNENNLKFYDTYMYQNYYR